MNVQDYTRILRNRWRALVVCLVVGIGLAVAATLSVTPQYRATAQLFVSTTVPVSGSGTVLNQGGEFAQDRVRSYADIVDTPLVLDEVIRRLSLTMSTQTLTDKVSAIAPKGTVLIDVTVQDPSPELARSVANSVATRFTEVAEQLETPAAGGTSPIHLRVVRPADLPQSPVTPRKVINLALGLFGGLLVGIGLAAYRELSDTSFKDGPSVSAALDLPVLGTIPSDSAMKRQPLAVAARPRSTSAEAYRQLRTNMQFVGLDDAPRSIVLTSALPQEGKSTTACNLAIAMSEAGLSVILIEADLRRPQVSTYLGLPGGRGLADILIGRATWQECLQPWGTNGKLQMLPCGSPAPNPSELVGSQHMSDLIEELEGAADIVLIDAPPLLPVADAAAMSRISSGALLVVRGGKTSRDQARQAVEVLRTVDAHLYGAVLNVAAARKDSPYGYGYAYEVNPATLGEAPEPS